MKVVVVIPIYKKKFSSGEGISFMQCLKVLDKHEICLLTHTGCDLSIYMGILKSYSVNFIIKYFDKDFFKDINGYNNLLLSKSFYSEFTDYDFMLIYQLDAFVFRDELIYWCSKNYDYIGAPWFDNFSENGILTGGVGNGGFSLRKISFFLKVFNWKYPLIKPSGILRLTWKYNTLFFFIIKIPLILLKIFGFRNTIKYFTIYREKNLNEDVFWSMIINLSWIKSNIPDEKEALKFCFERNPRKLFDMNKQKLPFGCHAWENNELDFWTPIIKKSYNTF